jgi:hypothetical protein
VEQSPDESLDYLVKSGKLAPVEKRTSGVLTPNAPASQSQAPELEAFAAKAVLEAIRRLEESQGGDHPGARLSACSKEVGMAGDVLIPLARRLEAMGLLETKETDSFGDNLVTVTDAGIQLLDAPQPDAILRRMEPA